MRPGLPASYSPCPCRPAGPCPYGHFYLEHSASCLPCFCFGVTSVCQSSSRFRDQIRLRFDQPHDFKGARAGGQQAPGSSRLGGRAQQVQESSTVLDVGPGSGTDRGSPKSAEPCERAWQGENNQLLGIAKSNLDLPA